MNALKVFKSKIKEAKETTSTEITKNVNGIVDRNDEFSLMYKWAVRIIIIIHVAILILAIMLENWLGIICKVIIAIQILRIMIAIYLIGYKNYMKIIAKSIL